ncbi:class I SAM-dependent methyltransferase [Herbiconiux daphne]|uniref:Class I SAM-dependent methyltransferase n=1 Tax=Herbiconiux daphne TaxID=2970914 RepID=A0ABT2H8S3_9MICO|nr:class I SAM-dependent methyltransferase [Herbiconiux daphne]MCS5736360.1 class I SAM-dependent methyltransferase [Herbiconiux daphne]
MIDESDLPAAEFWEDLYQQRPQIWSGRANQALVDIAESLPPRRALDLGSGEGGDSIWLAEHGWQVTGIDISATALVRAAEHAASRGVPAERITWLKRDLADWRPDAADSYDLVSACFLHSPVAFPRDEVLRRAAEAIAPGGLLLVVGHAAFPSWSTTPAHDHPALPTATEVAESLQLDPTSWTIVIAENRSRDATGPDGQHGTLDDAVLLVRRDV